MKLKLRLTVILCLITALLLTGCGYQKPEAYAVQKLSVDSITTVCQTDCRLSDVTVSADDKNCTTVYKYTDVAESRGAEDARAYHDYLRAQKCCRRIEDFPDGGGAYTAYIVSQEKIATGFTLKVAFTNDSYTVTITDNLIPDNIPEN